MLFRLRDNNHSVGIVKSCFAITPIKIKYMCRAGWYEIGRQVIWFSKNQIAKAHGVSPEECVGVYQSRNHKLPEEYKLLKELRWPIGLHGRDERRKK
jgi:hypothetical protein